MLVSASIWHPKVLIYGRNSTYQSGNALECVRKQSSNYRNLCAIVTVEHCQQVLAVGLGRVQVTELITTGDYYSR